MNSEMSNFQMMVTHFCIISSNTLILGYNVIAGIDSWLAFLISGVAAALFYILIVRIIRLRPGMDLFEIVESAFGPVVGRILAIALLLCLLTYSTLIVEYMSQFVATTTRNHGVDLVFSVVFIIVCIFLCKVSVHAFGRFINLVGPLIVITILLSFSVYFMRLTPSQLLPIMENGPKPVLTGAYALFISPFCNILLMFSFFKRMKSGKKFAKSLFISLAISVVIITARYAINIGVLGEFAIKELYYPSYMALSVLNIAPFFQRIEVLLAVHFILINLIKMSACIMFLRDGFNMLFKIKDKRVLIVPISLIVLFASYIFFTDTDEMFRFTIFYPFLYGLFMFAVPVATWIALEIKQRRAKKKEIPAAS